MVNIQTQINSTKNCAQISAGVLLADTITVDSALINNEVHFISDPITTMEDGVFEAVLKATKLHQTLKLEYKTAKDSE